MTHGAQIFEGKKLLKYLQVAKKHASWGIPADPSNEALAKLEALAKEGKLPAQRMKGFDVKPSYET
jgi:hypothetical protein